MQAKLSSSLRAVVAAFAAVVAAFTAAGVYENATLGKVDEDTRSLATIALPAMEHLTRLRSGLLQMIEAADDRIQDVSEGHGAAGVQLERSFQRLEGDLDRYLALGDERVHAEDGAVAPTIRAAITQVRRLDAALDARDVTKARTAFENDVRLSVMRAERELGRLIDVHGAHARDLADRLELVRGRARQISILLDILCVVLAALAATLAVRAVQRYARLVESQGRLLEERAGELEQFASRVAHDVLSPLTSVSLAIGQAKRRITDDAVLRYCDRAESSLGRVRTIVDALLTFARAGARPEPGANVEPKEVVPGVVEELRPQANAERIDLVLEPIETRRVACAPGVLTVLVGNLVRNAIKYMGDRTVRRIRVRAFDVAGVVRFEVEDTGPGIPKEKHDAIFERGVRVAGTGRAGLGLGLATVKRFVIAHGGRVGVESRPGEGSTFWFELPAVPTEAKAAEQGRRRELYGAST